MEVRRETAQIIQFPRSRRVSGARPLFSRADIEALEAPHVEVDGAWYHDAAIDEEKDRPAH